MRTALIALGILGLVAPGFASADILGNTDFSANFTGNSGSVSQNGAFDNWTRPGNHQWKKDPAGEWGYVVDNSGALSTIQLVHDQKASTGTYDLTFDYFIADDPDAGGEPSLRIQVMGILSDPGATWEMNNWTTGGLEFQNPPDGSSLTFLFDDSYSGDTGGAWTNVLVPDAADFGGGFDYIAVRIAVTGGDFEDDGMGNIDVMRIDNVDLIPEPATLGLLGVGGLVGLLRRRR